MSAAHEPDRESKQVNFRRRETEAGWQGVLDRFGLAAAPAWFQWLEWILVLGAFEYVAAKSGAFVARLVAGVSIVLLWFYFNGFFFSIEFKGWFRVQSATVERILSLAASGMLAVCFWYAAQGVAQTIAANTK